MSRNVEMEIFICAKNFRIAPLGCLSIESVVDVNRFGSNTVNNVSKANLGPVRSHWLAVKDDFKQKSVLSVVKSRVFGNI